MLIRIIKNPNENLRKKSVPLSDEEIKSEETKELIQNMFETMNAENGAGLAAPQVDVLKRMVVVNFPESEKNRVFINPEIVKKSLLQNTIEEGCLSVPGIFGLVKRPKGVIIKYQDENAEVQTEKCDSYLSRVIQHEIDHLEGILFIDKKIDKKI
jgi:peptide deformylase